MSKQAAPTCSCLCLREERTKHSAREEGVICQHSASSPTRYPHSLFFPASVEKASPLKTGLLASNPEDRGYPNDQGHEILHEEENQIRTTHLSDLERKKREKKVTQTSTAHHSVY